MATGNIQIVAFTGLSWNMKLHYLVCFDDRTSTQSLYNRMTCDFSLAYHMFYLEFVGVFGPQNQ